ncbi:MAG TPA: hypothetical protein VFJ68_03545 [Casimicrobiaceae bacterium]|nr:hypothetical protein [Casimicrobiaceae bacterium]
MTRGVRYYSYRDHSGYGLAALAYVRALHSAGVPVWWTPLVWRDGRHHPWRLGEGLDALPIAHDAANDAALQDLAAMVAATGPKAYDTAIVHTVPEHWPAFVERGERNIGYTVWETDTLPAHWRALLERADKILVPSAANKTLFESANIAPRVAAVPHIRRHAWSADSAAGRTLRRELGVPDDHFVFYSINVWDPRKAIDDLVAAFARTFCGDDKVTLIVKTSSYPHEHGCDRVSKDTIPERVRKLNESTARARATLAGAHRRDRRERRHRATDRCAAHNRRLLRHAVARGRLGARRIRRRHAREAGADRSVRRAGRVSAARLPGVHRIHDGSRLGLDGGSFVRSAAALGTTRRAGRGSEASPRCGASGGLPRGGRDCRRANRQPLCRAARRPNARRCAR